MATFEVLDELIEITGLTELHKRMQFWFVQEIAEEEGLVKFLHDRCDDLRRKSARRRVLIRELEALGERGVAVDSLECLKQTQARETAKLAGLTDVLAKTLTSIHEKEGLWFSVIKAIHDSHGSLDQPPPTCTGGYIWITIHKAVASLKSKGMDLLGFCKKVIGNGNNSNFWYDNWLGDVCVKVKFNRLFNLDIQKDASVAQKFQNPDSAVSFQRRPRVGIEESQFQELSLLLSLVFLSSSNDPWSWTLNGHGNFSVKSSREEIDKLARYLFLLYEMVQIAPYKA
ncbi:hypothetical protein Tco_1087452 [Tanacetum coccineum]